MWFGRLVYRLKKLTLAKIELKNRESLMFSVLKQSLIYAIFVPLSDFETVTFDSPKMPCFEIVHNKRYRAFTSNGRLLKRHNRSRQAECYKSWYIYKGTFLVVVLGLRLVALFARMLQLLAAFFFDILLFIRIFFLSIVSTRFHFGTSWNMILYNNSWVIRKIEKHITFFYSRIQVNKRKNKTDIDMLN